MAAGRNKRRGATGAGPSLGLKPAALAPLMPMFLWLTPEGRVRDAGPTLRKLFHGDPTGKHLRELFLLRRPRDLSGAEDVRKLAGTRLHLQLLAPPMTALRGIAVALAGNQGVLLNLSFGIGVAEAVRVHDLTDADFAPTDLTVEMLYLAEAKSAVMQELRALNRRLQQAKAAAEEQALTDTLTGLANRRAMDQAVDRLIGQATPFGLAHVDLDYFKQVNDSLGHAAGDYVLQTAARILRDETRGGDIVARVGGDEFVLIFPGLAQIEAMGPIADRIIARLSQPMDYRGQPCRITASIGMTVTTLYADPQADRLLSDADRALYASKSGGRGRATACSTNETPPPDRRGSGAAAAGMAPVQPPKTGSASAGVAKKP
jgi:diguanylate cyclase (GGDEF)-like protein